MGVPKDPKKYDEYIKKRSEMAKEKFKNKENHPRFGTKHSQESRKIMSEKAKGRIVKPETRRKIGESTSKRLKIFHHLKGTKRSDESNKKCSESVKEYYQNNPHPMAGKHYGYKPKRTKKTASPMKGKHHSEFTRMMMSKAHIGKNTWSRGRPSPLRGIPLKPEHIAKLKEKRRHRVIPKYDTKPERMIQIALALNGIKFEKHKPIIGQPDIFIEPNICLFVDGDYPHANPIKYKADDLIWSKTAAEKWAYDIFVNNELSKLGYMIIRLWESDINKNTQGCAENVIKMIKERMEVF